MSVTKVSSPMIEGGTKGADIASAATVVIGTDGSYFDITGTTGISTQFTVDAGRRFTLQFDGAVTITDNAAITLSGAANFTTAAGDILSFVATAANTVVQTGYSLVDGGSPAGGKVLKVVTSTDNVEYYTTTGQTPTNVSTTLNTAITPSATTSRILVMFNFGTIQVGGNDSSEGWGLIKFSTGGGSDANLTPVGANAVVGGSHHFGLNLNNETYQAEKISFIMLHSPGTTSELIYKPYFWGEGVGAIIKLNRTQRDDANDFSAVATCVLMEIAPN